MAETFANNAIGNLNASITNVATSLVLQAGQGSAFPASGNFRIVIGSEIIIVGARSGDTLSSLTRGAEGTANVAHNSGDTVTHEVTAGSLGTFAQTPILQSAVTFDAWQAYTPAWTSTGTAPTLGNGTLTGKFVQIGKTIIGRLRLTAGSTTTFGTGSYFLSAPVTAAVNGDMVGFALLTDAAVNSYSFLARLSTTTTFDCLTTGTAGQTQWAATAPFTFGNGDSMAIDFTYEAA